MAAAKAWIGAESGYPGVVPLGWFGSTPDHALRSLPHCGEPCASAINMMFGLPNMLVISVGQAII
jgi:hypothetical protein